MRFVERGLGLLAAACLFGMMTLTFVDVLGRKLLDRSLPGGLELTELMMLGLIFSAMPLTSLKGEHVLFDLLDRSLPRALRSVQGLISNLICAALMAGGAWLVFQRASRVSLEGDTTAQLLLPLAPFFNAVWVMLVITAGVHLVLAFRPDSDGDDDLTPGAL